MDALIILMIILFWFTIWMAVRHYYVFSREKRELLEHISDVTYTDVLKRKQKKKNRRGRLIQKLTKYAEDFSDLGQRVNFFSENHDVENWFEKVR